MAILEEVVYGAACRSIDQQEREFNDLRSRAATMFATAGAIVGLFASPVFGPSIHGHGALHVAGLVVAALATALTFLAGGYQLWPPPKTLRFRLDVPVIYEGLVADREAEAVYYAELAATVSRQVAANYRPIVAMRTATIAGLAGLAVEVAGLALATLVH
jgi:MFS family permease